jgi:tetratricopeptide (TPR) repeat protein
MASKDIEKLKDKFEKDLNSKLFLPLAEEYRKEGMLDEAIEVLQTGLEKHQAYTSARVLLGKIYLEKGMLPEARKEFESVIASVPDNLFAYKKLAEIYRDTGETEHAITASKAILRLNPMDDETLNNLKELESGVVAGSSGQDQAVAADAHGELKMPEESVPEAVFPEHSGEEISGEAEEAQTEHFEEDVAAFKDSLFSDKGTPQDEAELDAAEEEQFADEITIEEETIDESGQELTFEDVAAEVGQEESPAAGGSAAEIEQTEESADLMEDLLDADADMPRRASAGEVLDDADRCVAEEKFSEAMGIYRKYLSVDPDNKVVLQRVNELRVLLKLLGKDKEVLIAKLDAFLEGIHKRRNDFFGRP